VVLRRGFRVPWRGVRGVCRRHRKGPAETNQRTLPVPDVPGRGWQAYSLNYDREHGSPHYDSALRGDKGEPWRRLFMSDTATAFAILALAGSE
jgi:hypothetical protein